MILTFLLNQFNYAYKPQILFDRINFIYNPRILSRGTSFTFFFYNTFRKAIFPYFYLVKISIQFHVLFQLKVVLFYFSDNFNSFLSHDTRKLEGRVLRAETLMKRVFFLRQSREVASACAFSMEKKLTIFFETFDDNASFHITNIAIIHSCFVF